MKLALQLAALGAAGAAAVFVAALSVCAGPPWIGPERWAELLREGERASPLALSLTQVRLPRAVLAGTIGAGLSTGGLLTQTLAANPLATPSVLGITNGAMLALVLAMAFVDGLTEPGAMGASFLGAAISALAIGVVGGARRHALRGESLVVAGSILAAFAGSLVTAIVFLNSMQNELLGWTLGRLVHVDWTQAALAVPTAALGLLVAALVVGPLEALSLGEPAARGIGVRVALARSAAVVAIVLLAGGSVAAAGPVAYVGLLAPHCVRSWRLPPRRRLAACAAFGAALTGLADLLARWTSGPRVVPLGVWTMALGAALFFALSLRSQRGVAA